MKPRSLFDHIKNLFTKESAWDEMSDTDKKNFSGYMINRFISMDMNFVEVVNYVQSYNLPPRELFEVYFDVLPKQKGFFKKYIKGERQKTYNPELINMLTRHYNLSELEIEEALDIILEKYNAELTVFLNKFGLSDKDVKKLMKVSENEK